MMLRQALVSLSASDRIVGYARGALDVLCGVSLALVLQTSYRIFPSFGLGEFGLAIFCAIGIVNGLLNAKKYLRLGSPAERTVAALIIYLFILLLPVTVINFAAGTFGSSLRDWSAYALSILFLASLVALNSDLIRIARWCIWVTIISLVIQYLFGGEQAWYAARFTGGAANPNQLALYAVCVPILICVSFVPGVVRSGMLLTIFAAGLASLSDAYVAYLLAVTVSWVLILLVPRRRLLVAATLLLLLGCALVLVLGRELVVLGSEQWQIADEGGSRVILALYGLSAWLTSPFAFVFGNGAGAFSGIRGAFGAVEAHNTFVDMLAAGGVVGLFVVYYVPMRNALMLYREHRAFLLSLMLGAVAFSLFHFVARHPIWWFTMFLLFVSCGRNFRWQR